MSKDQFPKVKMSNNIFSIPIEGWSWPLIQRSLRARVLGSSAFWIVTTNPEILLEAKHDPVYTNTLHQADLRTVDGMGLWLALRLQGIRTTRLTGVELAEHLLAFAGQLVVALLAEVSSCERNATLSKNDCGKRCEQARYKVKIAPMKSQFFYLIPRRLDCWHV